MLAVAKLLSLAARLPAQTLRREALGTLRLNPLEFGDTPPDGLSIDTVLTREVRLVRSRTNASPNLLNLCIRELGLRRHRTRLPMWDISWDICCSNRYPGKVAKNGLR